MPRQVEKFRNHSANPTTASVVVHGHVPEQRGGVAEERAVQLVGGHPRLVQAALVVGQLADQAEHRLDVAGLDRAHRHDSSSFTRPGTSRASGESTGTSSGERR